jgi:hypothetical protein
VSQPPRDITWSVIAAAGEDRRDEGTAVLSARGRAPEDTMPAIYDPTAEAHRRSRFEIEFLDPGVEAFAFTFG